MKKEERAILKSLDYMLDMLEKKREEIRAIKNALFKEGAETEDFSWEALKPSSFIAKNDDSVFSKGAEIKANFLHKLFTPPSAVKIIGEIGSRSLVNAINRFLDDESKHDGIISINYIGQISEGVDSVLIHYYKKEEK